MIYVSIWYMISINYVMHYIMYTAVPPIPSPLLLTQNIEHVYPSFGRLPHSRTLHTWLRCASLCLMNNTGCYHLPTGRSGFHHWLQL
jgi:hypothetical protein